MFARRSARVYARSLVTFAYESDGDLNADNNGRIEVEREFPIRCVVRGSPTRIQTRGRRLSARKMRSLTPDGEESRVSPVAISRA